jgi:hypothetical protein
MKVELKFDLPEDSDNLNRALKADNAYGVLWDLDQYFRNAIKHGELPENEAKTCQHCRDKLNEFMDDNNISFNEYK